MAQCDVLTITCNNRPMVCFRAVINELNHHVNSFVRLQVRRNVIYNVYMFEPKRMVKADAAENVNSAEPKPELVAASSGSSKSSKKKKA